MTAILAVSGYLAANFEQIRSALFWNAEVIVTLADFGSIGFLNVGDGPVFALNFAVAFHEAGYEYIPIKEFPIGQMLDPGESFVVEIPTNGFFGCRGDTWLTTAEYGELSQKGQGSSFLRNHLPFFGPPINSKGEEITQYGRMILEETSGSYFSELHKSPTGSRIKYISFRTGKTIFQPIDLTTTWVGTECSE